MVGLGGWLLVFGGWTVVRRVSVAALQMDATAVDSQFKNNTQQKCEDLEPVTLDHTLSTLDATGNDRRRRGRVGVLLLPVPTFKP